MDISRYVKKNVRSFPTHVPNEQLSDQPFIRLNRNESPFPIPETILKEVRDKLFQDLNLYPDATANSLCTVAAKIYGLQPNSVMAGNGSSDLLSLIYRTFVDKDDIVAMPSPGFILNKDLAAIEGGQLIEVAWNDDFSLPIDSILEVNPKIIIIANPNNPTGTVCSLRDIEKLIYFHSGLVVLDEAYADYCNTNGLDFLKKYNNLILLRSFSKSFSAAGVRLGLAFANPEILAFIRKVQNIYSINRLSLYLGIAILENKELFSPLIKKTIELRKSITEELERRGFKCLDAQTNFIFAHVPDDSQGKFWADELQKRKILVCCFPGEKLKNYLRITIGKADEMSKLIFAIDEISSII